MSIYGIYFIYQITKGEEIMLAVQLQNPNVKIETTKIHEVLLSIGIPPNLLGYGYIISAMEIIALNPWCLHSITKELYVDIALKYGVSASSVERAIRNAISIGWLHGNIDYIYHIFKNCVNPDKGVPTNSIFLSRLFHYFNSVEFE